MAEQEMRTILVHLNVQVPESDTRTADEIGQMVMRRISSPLAELDSAEQNHIVALIEMDMDACSTEGEPDDVGEWRYEQRPDGTFVRSWWHDDAPGPLVVEEVEDREYAGTLLRGRFDAMPIPGASDSWSTGDLTVHLALVDEV